MYFSNFKIIKNISKWKFFVQITNIIDVSGHSEHFPHVFRRIRKKFFGLFSEGPKKSQKNFFSNSSKNMRKTFRMTSCIDHIRYFREKLPFRCVFNYFKIRKIH